MSEQALRERIEKLESDLQDEHEECERALGRLERMIWFLENACREMELSPSEQDPERRLVPELRRLREENRFLKGA